MQATRRLIQAFALIALGASVVRAVDDAAAGEVFASMAEAERTAPILRAVLEHGADAVSPELTDGLPTKAVRALMDGISRIAADPEPTAGSPDVVVPLPRRTDERKDQPTHIVGRVLYAYPKRRPWVLSLTAYDRSGGLRVSVGREPPSVAAEFTAVAVRAEAAKRRMIVDFRDPRVPCPIGDACWTRLKTLPTWTAIGDEAAVLRRRPDEFESLGDRTTTPATAASSGSSMACAVATTP